MTGPGPDAPTGRDPVPAGSPDGGSAGGASRAARLAWGAVVLLVAGVVALTVYALTRSPTRAEVARPATTSAGIVASLQSVPAAAFDAAGATVPGVTLTPPTVLSGQTPLQQSGTPEVLFVGTEYCPFCAAERWALVVALARFGRFVTLHNAVSAPQSVFGGIQTFSFVGTTYESPWVSLTGIELYSDQLGADGTFTRIAHLTPAQAALVARYSPMARGGTAGSAPFVDIGNRMVTTTSAFSPALLVGQSQAQITDEVVHPDTQASGGSPPPPTGQAVLAAANQLTAGICQATGGQPATVCTSKGVQAAAGALGLG